MYIYSSLHFYTQKDTQNPRTFYQWTDRQMKKKQV